MVSVQFTGGILTTLGLPWVRWGLSSTPRDTMSTPCGGQYVGRIAWVHQGDTMMCVGVSWVHQGMFITLGFPYKFKRGFWSSLNLVLSQLFSHQEEANSDKFYPKLPPLKAITMDSKQESSNSKTLYYFPVTFPNMYHSIPRCIHDIPQVYWISPVYCTPPSVLHRHYAGCYCHIWVDWNLSRGECHAVCLQCIF